MDPNTLRLMQGSAGAGAKLYVEDVFSTWLYTGNGSTQTITNGIDLSGKGGLVWLKSRTSADNYHVLTDTARGATVEVYSNAAFGQGSAAGYDLTSFNSNGFSLGLPFYGNSASENYVSWTFRKQAKFFDVVTYTGNGSNRTIAHNLGSVPGCIIVKRTDTTGDWQVYHRSLANTEYLVLNSTAAKATGTTRWNSTTATSTEFSLGTDATVNANAGTYVAYLFAHDAGGFGASGSDSIIKCGTYTGNGSSSGPQVDLSWEPQWLMLKRTNGAAGWYIYDNMRGVATGGVDANLLPNSSQAEDSSFDYLDFNATGFKLTTSSNDHNGSGDTYIYIAIRRGPMKTPTDATKVFAQIARTGTGAAATITGTGFAPDAMVYQSRSNATGASWQTRLQGGSPRLSSASTAAESADNELDFGLTMDGIRVLTGDGVINFSSWTYINYLFRRAPGFFDVVAYTGTGASQSLTHNLSAAPELIIVKARSTTSQWRVGAVFASTTYATGDLNNDTSWTTGVSYGSNWFSAQPTSTTFGVTSSISASSTTYIAYLFASCSGVSKVGSYTGTGTTLSIDCGFTNGARLVLIKRTDSTGDWYVWDSARGIVSGDDPYLLLNNTNAEVTGTDYVDPYSPGFQISSTAPAAINANGGSFIFLAVA